MGDGADARSVAHVDAQGALDLAELADLVEHVVGDLLLRALSRGIAGDYVRSLLAACDEPVAPDVLAAAVDPLTERELEILRLLPTSLSTVEMAEQLIVAPSTVRTHIKSIYSKLQVNRRVDAVKRAGELKLL